MRCSRFAASYKAVKNCVPPRATSSPFGYHPARLAPRFVSLRPAHRAAIESLLERTGVFPRHEIEVALELVDHGLSSDDQGYRFVVLEVDDVLVGYACFGLASLSDGVFDLFWIAVDPQRQGGGYGRALLAAVDRAVLADAGRLVVAETEGGAPYEATRAFYERTGFRELGRIPDFYRLGADKVFYGRAPLETNP